jgi:hypothetical protein
LEEIVTAIFGETLTFSQENGPDVQLNVFGDEFYARYETEDGYTVIYDPALGLFSYVLLDEGRFVSSGVPISEVPPPEVQPHAREADAVRQAKAAEKINARLPPDLQSPE